MIFLVHENSQRVMEVWKDSERMNTSEDLSVAF